MLSNLALFIDTSRQVFAKDMIRAETGGIHISFTEAAYNSIEEYDSLQKRLPVAERDGWFKRRLIKKQIGLNEKFREDPEEASGKLVESILHRLPYMLFVSLPLFAFILKLVYIRRKQFYYADHGVFTIHLYIFTFLLLLLVFGLGTLKEATGWGGINFLTGGLFIALLFYLYRAMRNFYGQKRAKTFFKFLVVTLASLIMMLVLFVLFMFFSVFTL